MIDTPEEIKFATEFNPMRYYRRIREMGVPEDVARKVTHYYNERVFAPLVDLYKWKYRVVEDSHKQEKVKGKW